MATYKEQAEALQEQLDAANAELETTKQELATVKKTATEATAKLALIPNDVVAAYDALKVKVATDKASLDILHPILVACTRLKPCRTVDELKHNMQKFRDIIGAAEANERERKWR